MGGELAFKLLAYSSYVDIVEVAMESVGNEATDTS
jgi:hypothetical protein